MPLTPVLIVWDAARLGLGNKKLHRSRSVDSEFCSDSTRGQTEWLLVSRILHLSHQWWWDAAEGMTLTMEENHDFWHPLAPDLERLGP